MALCSVEWRTHLQAGDVNSTPAVCTLNQNINYALTVPFVRALCRAVRSTRESTLFFTKLVFSVFLYCRLETLLVLYSPAAASTSCSACTDCTIWRQARENTR